MSIKKSGLLPVRKYGQSREAWAMAAGFASAWTVYLKDGMRVKSVDPSADILDELHKSIGRSKDLTRMFLVGWRSQMTNLALLGPQEIKRSRSVA